MLIAAIRTGHALAGKAISYSEDDGKFWLTGVGEVPPVRLLEYESAGELEWADDETRAWVIELASGATAAPLPDSDDTAVAEREKSGGPPPEPPTPAAAPGGDRPEPEPAEPQPAEPEPAEPAPVAIPISRTLKKQARPEFVEGAKQRWRPSEAQVRTIAYVVVGACMIAAIVLLAVVGVGRDDTSGKGTGWTEVGKLSGTSSDRGPAFELDGGRHRIEFTAKRAAPNVATSYDFRIVPAVADGQATAYSVEEGLIATNFAAGEKTGAAPFDRPTGTYYLDVVSSNCEWTVRVWDEK